MSNFLFGLNEKQIVKPQLHIHVSGHGRAMIHSSLSNRGASAWFVVAP